MILRWDEIEILATVTDDVMHYSGHREDFQMRIYTGDFQRVDNRE